MAEVYRKSVNRKQVRYIVGGDKKHQLFVSDLVEHFGRGFLSKKGIRVKKTRVAGQARRLIAGSDISKLNLVPVTKAKKKGFKVEAVIRLPEKAKDKPLLGVLNHVDRHARDFDKVNEQVLRGEFARLCSKIAGRLIESRKLSKKDIENSDRWIYREVHRTIYFEFDRILGHKLEKRGRSLKDFNLGYGTHTGNYIDCIVKAGMLSELLAVARKMINNTDKTGKTNH
jgi:predicted secreted protein